MYGLQMREVRKWEALCCRVWVGVHYCQCTDIPSKAGMLMMGLYYNMSYRCLATGFRNTNKSFSFSLERATLSDNCPARYVHLSLWKLGPFSLETNKAL